MDEIVKRMGGICAKVFLEWLRTR